MEHVKIADRGAVILLKVLTAGRGKDEKLFSGTSSQFTAALKAITDFFGISNRDGVGITWGVPAKVLRFPDHLDHFPAGKKIEWLFVL